tara:strand:- start:48 stop:350 length:303 start_codon:yes stop_codon:yes gene_type:complete
MKRQKKTLRECLLSGEVKGRYFKSDVEPHYWGVAYGGYKVVDIKPYRHNFDEITDLIVIAIGAEEDLPCYIYLSRHLDDVELNEKEITEIRKGLEQKFLV